jgi:CubicO group peptidase (beta-lactamase class C family)
MKLPSVLRSITLLMLLCGFSVALSSCLSLRPTATPTLPPRQASPATAASAALRATVAAPGYWPTQGWRTSSPAEQGMDAAKLDQMLEAVKAQNLNFYSLLVIRNGHIVSENYFGTTRPDTRREIYSCTKSFIATLVGIAIDKGAITGVEQPVASFFPNRAFENNSPAKAAMTLEHLLTMTSGLEWVEGDPAYRAMYGSRDWVKSMMDMPMRSRPGSQFNYCSGCSHVLSAIIQAKTRMNTRDFAERELFAPLGITGARWDTDTQGIPIGGWGLQLTPREMAKLGFLYLHSGVWDGRQIVSPEWVRTATEKHTSTDSQLGYGYQWWIYPRWGAYAALGLNGQTIFVIPDLDLIVVTTAAIDGHDAIFRLIDEYIVPAAQKPS